MSEQIQHKFGAAGGYLVGNSHADGGIKAINKSTDQLLEFEGGEVAITKTAVQDTTKREFQGEMLTNRQILSKINESGGGVSFANGGEIPSEMYWYGRSYQYGGVMMKDVDIIRHISKCGCDHEEFKKGGVIDYASMVLNGEPTTPEELTQYLLVAEAQGKPKKEISKIQENYFNEFVQGKPKQLIPYLKAVWHLPKGKRETFFYEWNHDDYLKVVGDNIYNFLPEDLKKLPVVKKINFSPTPDNEGLDKITSPFTNRDDLRPKFSGVYFNLEDESIYVTNAHVILFIKEKPHVDKSSICLMGSNLKWYKNKVSSEISENPDGCWELKEAYPDIFRIIPKTFENIISVSASRLLQYIKAAENFIHPITHEITLAYRYEDRIIKRFFNAVLLQTCVEAMLELGYEEIDLCFNESSNRPVIILPKGNSRKISYAKIETDMTVVMPLLNSGNEYVIEYMPVYDLDNQAPTTYFKMTGRVPEGERYEFNISEIHNYPAAIKVLEGMSDFHIRHSIKGGCSSEYTLARKTHHCVFYLHFLDFSVSPYDTYHIIVLDEYSTNNIKNLEKEAFKKVKAALNNSEEITEAITALEILMPGSGKKERKEIQSAIEALKILFESKKFEEGGVIDEQMYIATPLSGAKAPSAIELIENL